MVKVTLMSQAEYAKHRGVSHVAVHKAIKEERIMLIGGKIDPMVADIQWSANTRARAPSARASAHGGPGGQGGHGGPGGHGGGGLGGSGADVEPGMMPAGSAAVGDGGTAGPDDAAGDGYWKSRARREKAEASIAEMKQAEIAGELIRVDAVRSAWAAKITTVRDALLQIPSRLAPQLAAESDLVQVTLLLEAELRQALADLSAPASLPSPK